MDYALTRGDVDPDRIAILGVSQGGYWVPRAVAFEPRIAAAVADPGVVDVSRTMTDHLPGSMRKLLDAWRVGDGDVDAWHREWSATADGLVEVDREVGAFAKAAPLGDTPVELVEIPSRRGRRSPACLSVAANITCPTLLTAAEGDPIAAGAAKLLDVVAAKRKTLVAFTENAGAGGHLRGCRPPVIPPALLRLARRDAGREP